MKVISYNCLLSSLCNRKCYPEKYYSDDVLDCDNRRAMLLGKIEFWKRNRYIICLQELDKDLLISLRLCDDYEIFYTPVINGNSYYEIICIMIPKELKVIDWNFHIIKYSGKETIKRPIISVTLEDYTIANVHVPCLWKVSSKMQSFVDGIYNYMKSFDIFILCGDFNMHNKSRAYKHLESKFGIPASDYPFTNKVMTDDGIAEFVLDYIFTKNIDATSGDIEDGYAYYPNLEEPSDHIPICITI